MIHKIGTAFLILAAICLVVFCGSIGWLASGPFVELFQEEPEKGVAFCALVLAFVSGCIGAVLLSPDFRD